MVHTSVICESCKRLVPVLENKLVEHNTPQGKGCLNSGMKHVPQKFNGGGPSTRGPGDAKLVFERVDKFPDPSTLDFRGLLGPIKVEGVGDVKAAIFTEKDKVAPETKRFSD